MNRTCTGSVFDSLLALCKRVSILQSSSRLWLYSDNGLRRAAPRAPGQHGRPSKPFPYHVHVGPVSFWALTNVSKLKFLLKIYKPFFQILWSRSWGHFFASVLRVANKKLLLSFWSGFSWRNYLKKLPEISWRNDHFWIKQMSTYSNNSVEHVTKLMSYKLIVYRYN